MWSDEDVQTRRRADRESDYDEVTDEEPRTPLRLSTAAKVSFMVAALLLVLAVYFYFVPINLRTSSGGSFGCGSAASPPGDSFPRSICLDAPRINAFRAYALVAAALITAGLGRFFFAVSDSPAESSPSRASDTP